MTPQELGQRVKAKYPQYASMSDEDVATRVSQKYPQYQAQITQPEQVTPQPQAQPKENSYPGENIVKAAAGPVYEPAKAAVQGYMGLRKGVGDVSSKNVPDTGFNVPMPTRGFLPHELLIPGQNYPLQMQRVTGKQAARDLSGMVLDSVATLGASKVFGGVNNAGLTRLGSAEATNPGTVQRLKAMKVSNAGRPQVSRLLPTANTADDIKARRPAAVEVEGFNVIKKSKNPLQIVDRFANESEKVLSQVDELVKTNNRPIDRAQIRERIKQILSDQFANSSPDDVRALNEAIDGEMAFDVVDSMSANARKRFLYQKTKNIQKAQAKGTTIVSRPEQSLVEDAASRAYKEAIEEAHPDIAGLNARWGGLDAGETAAANLSQSTRRQGPLGDQLASNSISQPSKRGIVQSALEALVDKVLGPKHQRISGKIERMNKQYGELLSESRKKQAPRLIGKQFYQSPAKPTQTPREFPLGYDAGDVSKIVPGQPPQNVPMSADPNEALRYAGGAGNYQPQMPKQVPMSANPEDALGYAGGAEGYTPQIPQQQIEDLIERVLGYKGPNGPINIPPVVEKPKIPYNDPGVSYKDPGPINLKNMAKKRKKS